MADPSEIVNTVPPTRRAPATDDFPTGPALGDALPDFTLADQQGEFRKLQRDAW